MLLRTGFDCRIAIAVVIFAVLVSSYLRLNSQPGLGCGYFSFDFVHIIVPVLLWHDELFAPCCGQRL